MGMDLWGWLMICIDLHDLHDLAMICSSLELPG